MPASDPATSGWPDPGHRLRIVVIGGGIAGLAAAWTVAAGNAGNGEPAPEVVLLESTDQVGGKIRASEFEGIQVDEGAESMLVARPEALALAQAVGLAGDIVNPATTQAGLFVRHRLRPLPPGLISGIPTDLHALAESGIMTCRGLARIPLDHWLPRTTIDGDVSVGDYVSTRLGPEVVDKLVDPMLGGVYAGRAEDLSLEATVPALFRLARQDRSLLSAAKEVRHTGAAPSGARRGPVFAGIEGGLGRLPGTVANRLEALG
ncbi:MAG: protoporphyrinogen oxidase, partial [Candidatus Nanopelagicales bacterium]|nr:protoporphyrinogen oxidase [Candidatus Nanopelagicales bacterium]